MEFLENIKNRNINASNNHEQSREKNEKISESKKKTLESNETSKKKNILFTYHKIMYLIAVTLIVLTFVLSNMVVKKDLTTDMSVVIKPKYLLNNKQSFTNLHIVLKRLGYEQVPNNTTDWDLAWTVAKPSNAFFRNLKIHQRVKYIPSIDVLTSKSKLSASKNKYIPRSFLLPKNKKEFLNYTKNNPDVLFVQKLNTHRGVKLKNASDMDFSGKSFAQEFVKNPFLIDGYKFDIGIYMVLISVDPLRIYWYKEDVLIRFCPHKFNPFNARDFNSNAFGDKYKPTWEIPSLEYYFNRLGIGLKGSFDSYMRTLDIDPDMIWNKATAAIADVILMKEHHFIKGLQGLSPVNYFVFVRVDLLLDNKLNVYITEFNFGPNIDAKDKPTNELLYQQVLYNLFRITGIASRYKTHQNPESPMISAPKNIATWGAECASDCVQRCDVSEYCDLCTNCRTKELTDKLMAIHTENLNKGAFRRLFPPRLEPGNTLDATG